MRAKRFLVVTPARDEAAYIGDLAESLLRQTLPPARWIMVDDGSTDGTVEVVRGAVTERLPLEVVRREDRAVRRAGCGDLEAALAGLVRVPDLDEYDYVAKIDADLVLPADYFERLFEEFERDPSLGIAGGHCYNRTKDGRLELEPVPEDHVHGATKVYRRECLRQLWPLDEVWGWDTVDECKAQMLGWTTRSFLEPGVIHQKPMTGGVGRPLRGKFVLGRISHFLGYRPDYLLVRAVRHLGKPPYVLGGVAMAWGYLSAVLLRRPTFGDERFKRYLRRTQAERLRGLLRRLPQPKAG